MTGRRFDGPGIGASTGVQLHPKHLEQPLHWRRPRMIFVNSMADLFHADVPDEFIARVFGVMGLAWQHTFQVLTKRPARMRSLLADPAFEDAVFDAAMDGSLSGRAAEQGRGYWAVDHGRSMMMPLSNVWLGVSVENQRWAEQRIPLLRATPAAVRFLSCEPLLDEVDLTPHLLGAPGLAPGLDWVIAGGESGPGARPMSPRWVRQLRDQCTAADVAFTFKQWGEWTDVDHGLDAAGEDDPLFRRCTGNNRVNGHRMRTVDGQLLVRLGRHKTGRVLDGSTWDQFPARGTQHEPAGGTL